MKKKKEIFVELREESYKDYLYQLDSERLNQLYENSLLRVKESKKKDVKKEQKINTVYDDISFNIVTCCALMVDEDIQMFKDIFSGKKISFIPQKFLSSNIICMEEEDSHISYYMYRDIQEAVKKIFLKDGISEDRIPLVVDFYLRANGVLSLDKILELVEITGFHISLSKLEEIISSAGYRLENNLVYYNDFAYDMNSESNFFDSKEEVEYPIFSLEEVVSRSIIMSMMFDGVLQFLKKNVKDKTKVEETFENFINFVCYGSNYKELVEQYLSKQKIQFSSKKMGELFKILQVTYFAVPSWELNGNSPMDFFEEDSLDEDDFESLSKEEKVEVLVHSYMLINGVMKFKDLIDILEKHHNIKTNKKEIVQSLKEEDDVEVVSDYIRVSGLGEEEVSYLFGVKKLLKKYKVIEDIDLFYDEYDEVFEEFDHLYCYYDLDEECSLSISSILRMLGALPEEVLDEIFRSCNVKMSHKKKMSFLKEVKKLAKNVRVWQLNGFSTSELQELDGIGNQKPGRNDLCECGSGKKYKKCCGR